MPQVAPLHVQPPVDRQLYDGPLNDGPAPSTASSRRARREAERAAAARVGQAAAGGEAAPSSIAPQAPIPQPAHGPAPQPAAQPARRRDVRLAERTRQVTARVRRVRSATRFGVLPLIAAIVVPGAVVGGVAFARVSNSAGDISLNPGQSAVVDSGVSFADGQAGVTFQLPGRPATSSLYVGLELRRSASGLYRTKARVYPDGTVTVDLGKVVNGGAEQFLGTKKIPATVAAGATALTMQSSIKGGTVSFRVFVAGSATVFPPYQLTVADQAPVAASGSVRVWSYLSSRATAPMKLRYVDLDASTGIPVPEPTATTVAPTPKPTPTTVAPTTAAPRPTTTAPTTPPTTTSPPADPGSPGMSSVLRNSGADLDTNYAYPAGAVVVPAGGSIAQAIAQAPAGGTVVLHGGTYRQAVGSVNKPLTIQAYPHEKPVISGLDVVSGWTASGGAWHTSSWTSPFGQNQFRPDEVPAGTAAGKVEQAYRNGAVLRQVLTRSELAAGTFWVDPASRQLWVADNPTGATMELSNRERGMTLEPSAKGSRILGLRFTGFAGPHLDNGSQLYVGSSNTLIQNSMFDHSSSAGLKLAAANITVDHVTAAENAAEGMTGNRTDNSVIKNSQFLRNNRDNFKSVGCAMSCTVAGFKAAHTANLSVLNSAFVDNIANGFWCDLGCTNGTISGNAISGSYDGIFYEVSSRATITGNYVEKSDKGIRVSGSDHVTITGNTLVNNNWQLTVYDDRRSSSTDAYSAGLGLSWNTTQLVIDSNRISAGAKTTKLLEMNATAQVASPGMFTKVAGNSNAGNETMIWCPVNNSCRSYATISAWRGVSGLGF